MLMPFSAFWNPTHGHCNRSQMQAIDRVHRLGQTRPVRVYRFLMKDTIEERMLTTQRAKATMGKGTIKKLSRKCRKRFCIYVLRSAIMHT